MIWIFVDLYTADNTFRKKWGHKTSEIDRSEQDWEDRICSFQVHKKASLSTYTI